MISEIARVHSFFKEFVFGFMFHDIDSAISGKANFLAALGLLDYTEILGGLVTGNLKELHKARENFDSFIPYLGQWYVNLDTKLKAKNGIYGRIRCGLAHEYFIKGKNSTIYMYHLENPDAKGIDYFPKQDRIEFVVDKFFSDFKAGAEIYHGQLVFEKKKTLLAAFNKAI